MLKWNAFAHFTQIKKENSAQFRISDVSLAYIYIYIHKCVQYLPAAYSRIYCVVFCAFFARNEMRTQSVPQFKQINAAKKRKQQISFFTIVYLLEPADAIQVHFTRKRQLTYGEDLNHFKCETKLSTYQ